MKKRSFWKKGTGILAAVSMIAVMLAGCGSTGDTASSADAEGGSGELTEVTMASPTALASLDLCFVYAADGLGYFEDEGIKLNMVECTDGSDPRMVAAGEADFGGFSPSVGLSAVDSGVDNIKAVCNNVCCNMFGFAFNKESGISDWSDINGKTIAVVTDTFSVIFNPILEAAGVDTSTVTYVTYGSAEYEALDSNQAPLMGTWLAEYYMCQGMGYDWGYLSGEDVLPQIANSVWVNTDYAEKNPQIVEGFVRAVCKAMYACYLNPEVVADIVLDRYPSIEITWDGAVGSVEGNVASMFGMTEDEQKARIDNHEIGVYDMEMVQQTIENLVVGGAISQSLSAEDYYTNEYIDEELDYSSVQADLDAYEFVSSVYKEAHQ